MNNSAANPTSQPTSQGGLPPTGVCSSSAPPDDKTKFYMTFFLGVFLGILGVHRFYLRKIGTGLFQLVTLGGLGIWWLVDMILILLGKFKDKQGLAIPNINPKLSWSVFAAVVIIGLASPVSQETGSSGSVSDVEAVLGIPDKMANSPLAQKILRLTQQNAYSTGFQDGVRDADEMVPKIAAATSESYRKKLSEFKDLQNSFFDLMEKAQPNFDKVVFREYKRGWNDGASSTSK